MGSAVGIYLKNGSVQAALVAGSARRLRLKRIVESPWPGQQPLGAWLAEHRLPKRQLSVALPSRMVSVRKTALPLTQPAQIRRTIRFHAERLIPGISPEDVIVDFLVTKREPDFTELLLFVVNKADLKSHFDVLGLNGADTDSVTIDFVALFNLLARKKMFAGATTAAVVDFSGEGTSFLLARDGQLRAFRKLPALEGTDTTNRIARLLTYTLTAAGFPVPPDRVILSGKIPPDLDPESCSEKLGCDVRICVPPPATPAAATRDRRVLLQESPVPVGATLDAFGGTAAAINFRRRQPVLKTPYETVRGPLLLIAVLLVGWLATELVGTMQRTSDAREYLTKMQGHARSLYTRVVKGSKPRFSASFHKTLEAIAKERAGTAGGARSWGSFLDFLSLLTEHIPGDYRTMVQSVNFRGTKAIIRGEADDVDSFEALAEGLEKSGLFEVRTPFQIRSGRRNRPAKLSFTIELSPRRK